MNVGFTSSDAAARLESLAAAIAGAPKETMTVTVVRFAPGDAATIAGDLNAIAGLIKTFPAPAAPPATGPDTP